MRLRKRNNPSSATSMCWVILQKREGADGSNKPCGSEKEKWVVRLQVHQDAIFKDERDLENHRMKLAIGWMQACRNLAKLGSGPIRLMREKESSHHGAAGWIHAMCCKNINNPRAARIGPQVQPGYWST